VIQGARRKDETFQDAESQRGDTFMYFKGVVSPSTAHLHRNSNSSSGRSVMVWVNQVRIIRPSSSFKDLLKQAFYGLR
jgi:hypothetical protein